MNNFLSLKQPVFSLIGYLTLALVILLCTILFANFIRRLFTKFLERSSEDIKVNVAQYSFIKHLVTALIYICGIGLAVSMIPPLRNVSISLFAGSGILAIIVGFAAQQSFANIVSGIFITIFQPFRVGDRVKMMGKDITGTIEDITLRHTVIRTFENKRVIIPNSVISTEVIENANFTDNKICKFVEMSIGYDSNITKAKQIMHDEAIKHPFTIDNRDYEQKLNNEPVVVVRLVGFSDSAVILRAWVWTEDQPSAFQLGCDLYESIKARFDDAGIEIPFPHRKIIYEPKETFSDLGQIK